MSLLARLNRTTRKSPSVDDAVPAADATPVREQRPAQPAQPLRLRDEQKQDSILIEPEDGHALLDLHELVLDDVTPEAQAPEKPDTAMAAASLASSAKSAASRTNAPTTHPVSRTASMPEARETTSNQNAARAGILPPQSRVEPRSPTTQVAARLAEAKSRTQDQARAAQPQQAAPKPAPSAPVAAPAGNGNEETHDEGYYLIKAQIHERLIELLDLSAVESLPPAKLREEISRLVEKLLREEFRQAPLNGRERRGIIKEIQDEVLGLGPLEPLLQDPTVSDILVNNYRMVYVERHGKLQKVQTRFKDDNHLRKIIDRIVAMVGRRVDEASPMVDARLMDGSRVNAIIPPLALDGPSLSIRRFSKDPLELADLINFKALTPEIGKVLEGIVKARLNIIVSGGTGSGKTTMLNCLSRFVPHDERIVTIEDAAELQLKQDHVVRLETRPANIEGTGEVNARDLVKNCLRMRPDRIIVGEVRSSEVLDMLQAMNTGHDGSLTTIHANNPRDCLMRLETMVAMSGLNIASNSLKRYISSAVDVIIQVNRLSDGSRKLTSLQEVTGMEGDAITMQEIFAFKQTGLDENRKVVGKFVCSGIRPKFSERLLAQGIELDPSLFDPSLGNA
ncbi:CpaF family protein [Desulfovibrio mangrovi]|uniref:CpaF family protein n=1 Tax=Desulfovibrio mangrovi TaxID=2976983 RepID=UPI0030845227